MKISANSTRPISGRIFLKAFILRVYEPLITEHVDVFQDRLILLRHCLRSAGYG